MAHAPGTAPDDRTDRGPLTLLGTPADRVLTPALLFLAVMGHAVSSRGELLYFAAGGQVQAPATVSAGRVRIETPVGPYSFREEDFRKIVPGHSPEREWPSRRLDALRGGAGERTAAAWWALENGLVPEAVALLRAAREADPVAQPSARLNAVLDRLERPTDDPPTDRLAQALATPCEVERGPHVLLLHQHDPPEARARVDLSERVMTAYYLVFAAQGVDLSVTSRRFVSVYLRHRRDYRTFLAASHAGAFGTTLGYYHPTFRAVIAFDERSTGKLKAEARPTPSASVDSPNPGSEDVPLADPEARDRRRLRLLRALEWRARDLGTAAHETVHLLVAESGLAPRPGEFPQWLHEGLAAQFEVVRGGRWAGVGRAHDLRLPDWKALSAPPDLTLITRDKGFGQGYRRDLYAGCWSLVYFLRQTRGDDFLTLIDRLRAPDRTALAPDPGRHAATFEAVFGEDLKPVESAWRTFMRGVRTPLEEHAPPDRVNVRNP